MLGCKISKADLDTGSEPQPTERDYVHKLGGHDSCTDDDAGHILANQLGGKAVPTNLFPQEPHLNRGAWEQFEKKIYACVKDGAATLSWTFSYASTKDQRPSKATFFGGLKLRAWPTRGSRPGAVGIDEPSVDGAATARLFRRRAAARRRRAASAGGRSITKMQDLGLPTTGKAFLASLKC